jgi:hypothetical protein
MEQPQPADRGPEDVLSMGEGRTLRWGPWLAVLVVLLVGIGAYRVVSGPSTPASPPAAAAEDSEDGDGTFAGDSERDDLPSAGGFVNSEPEAEPTTSVRLGGELVTLRGSGIHVPQREASATALGRLREGWIVELTSTACEDSTDTRVSYGFARPSGRFTAWTTNPSARRPVWRSPDRALVLVEDRRRLVVQRASTGELVTAFRTAA